MRDGLGKFDGRSGRNGTNEFNPLYDAIENRGSKVKLGCFLRNLPANWQGQRTRFREMMSG